MKTSILKVLVGIFLAGFIMVLFSTELSGQEQKRIERPALPERSDQVKPYMDINDGGYEGPQIAPVSKSLMDSKAKATGMYTIGSGILINIPDNGSLPLTYSTSETIPEGAVITNVAYQILVDDRGDPDNFWCNDYEIWLSTASHISLKVECLWDNDGLKTDNDEDDDSSNDSDIYLLGHTHAFDGEPADQSFTTTFYDNISISGEEGLGLKNTVYLLVSWETPEYNLDATITPSGWNGPILVRQSGGYSELYTGLWTDVNFSYYSESDIPSSESYSTTLSDNGSEIGTWSMNGASEGGPYMLPDNLQLQFTAGEHILCQRVDWLMDIDETDEEDNVYCETFTFYGPPAAPSLTYPSHQASCQPLSIEFDWSTSSHAMFYQLQVDDNDDFSSPVFSNDELISSQMIVGGLNNGAQYYWRVRAINPAGNGSWTSTRSFRTVQASAPGAPGLSSPGNGVLCQPTSLSVDWSESSGASSYHLQIDDNDDFSSPVVNQSGISETDYDVSGLSDGVKYYWRVAAVNSCSMSSAWSVRRSFTTASIPSTPGLSSPGDAATCQSTSLTLSWSSISGATEYQLRLDDNADFSSPEVEESDISGTSTSVSGLSAGTTYHWCVRAQNSCGNWSGWSSVRSFVTSPATPGIPSMTSPVEDALCQPVSLNLEWNAVGGASSYDIQLDDNDDFSSPLVNEAISATSKAVSGLAEGTVYYWRIRSENSCGAQSAWTSSNTFTTTISSIGTPVLTGPEDVSTCQPTSPTLTWSEVAGATGYSIEVDDNTDFSSPEITASCSGTTYNCTELLESTSYNWRISANGICSVTGSWSESWSFQTGTSGMESPGLSEPADNSAEQPLSLNLSWDPVSEAESYQLQLDDNDDFSSPLYDDEVSSNSVSVSGLNEGTTYYWQVRAIGSCSTGDWSETWEFDTEGDPNAISHYTEQEEYYLGQNYPNPFMETTTIEFKLPVNDNVSIEFMDMQGKVIKSLSGFYVAGAHSVEIDLQGKYLPGVYLYRMRTTGFIETKMCIVR